jgi:hypothetical protein
MCADGFGPATSADRHSTIPSRAHGISVDKTPSVITLTTRCGGGVTVRCKWGGHSANHSANQTDTTRCDQTTLDVMKLDQTPS